MQAQYFKNDADTAINEDNYNFGKRVANAPTPSDRSVPDRYSRMHANSDMHYGPAALLPAHHRQA